MPVRITIVDADPEWGRLALASIQGPAGIDARLYTCGEEALAAAEAEGPPDIVYVPDLSSSPSGQLSAFDLIDALRRLNPSLVSYQLHRCVPGDPVGRPGDRIVFSVGPPEAGPETAPDPAVQRLGNSIAASLAEGLRIKQLRALGQRFGRN